MPRKLVILAYISFTLITFIKDDLFNVYLTLNLNVFKASYLNTWVKIRVKKGDGEN